MSGMAANYRTIDAHVGGQPVRLIVEGFPAPKGRSLTEKRDWARRNAEGIRRALMFEPRGHRDMCGAVLTEPSAPGSHAGVLFMDSGGYATFSGSAIIALATIALERGLLMPGGDGQTIVFDTLAGVVRAKAAIAKDPNGTTRVERVAYVSVPSFVLAAGLPVKIAGRSLRVDVAFGGGFYAIVDSESVGLGVTPAHAAELRRAGMAIREAVQGAQLIAHPLDARLEGIEGTIFTAPASSERADLASVTVFADGAMERSAGGNSTAAVMAVLSAMGLLDEDTAFRHEGITGSTFTGRISLRTLVGDYDAIKGGFFLPL
jgi:proline racemase